jgi:DNA-binding MarR family transcriptional regulator
MSPSRASTAVEGTDSSVTRVADELHSAAIHLLRALRRVDDETGLSAPRLSALSVVVFAGPLTLGALAAAEGVRPPTMTRLVTALADAGLVTRTVDPGDARLTRVAATARGRKILMRGRARRLRVLAERLELLSASELQTLGVAAELIGTVARSMR